MIKGIIAALAFIVVVAGGYSLYAFYQKMQNSGVVIDEEPHVVIPPKKSLAAIPKMQNTEDNKWISSTDQITKTTNYQFPANVLNIAIEVKREQDLKTDYTKVLVKNLDDYKFFCLNEILRQKHIDFSYFKNQNSLDLLLFVPDETKRHALLRDFEYYGIEYEISLKK